MANTTSYIFQNDESETLYVNLEMIWVPNLDDT